MAKQTFTAGQVLTAAEMNSLQENDYNWTVDTKTASYTLAAGDEGTRIVMNNAGATTITVDDAVFSAGDVVWIHNIGAGTCTITAGTATVSTLGELALEQYAGGHLYFTSASAAIFFPTEQGGGGKILQVVFFETATTTTTSSTSFVDTSLAATITPSSASSRILIIASVEILQNPNNITRAYLNLYRGNAATGTDLSIGGQFAQTYSAANVLNQMNRAFTYVDSPATTSATTYTVAIKTSNGSVSVSGQQNIVLMEVSA